MQIKLIFTRKILHLPRFESEMFWNSEMAHYCWFYWSTQFEPLIACVARVSVRFRTNCPSLSSISLPEFDWTVRSFSTISSAREIINHFAHTKNRLPTRLLMTFSATKYRKIPKISPGANFFQRPFLMGLFLKGLIYGGTFAFQNRLG